MRGRDRERDREREIERERKREHAKNSTTMMYSDKKKVTLLANILLSLYKTYITDIKQMHLYKLYAGVKIQLKSTFPHCQTVYTIATMIVFTCIHRQRNFSSVYKEFT